MVDFYKNYISAFYNIIAGEEIIGQFDGQDRRYYVKDHLGSTRMTINNSQGIDGFQDYYPFGKINLSDSRRMPGRSYTSGNLYDNYKFTGHACPDIFGERDDEFDLTLDYTCPPTGAMQARMYDPVIGRFLSVDPLVELYPDWSPYTYTLNNPINFIDPTGSCPEDGSAGKNQWGPGYCLEAVEVTAPRYEGNVQNVGGPWGAWLFAMMYHPLSSFGLESLINRAGKLNPGKSGKIGSIEGNALDILKGLARQSGATIKQTPGGKPYFQSGNTTVHLYKSTTTELPTLTINKAGKIYKIRIK